MSSDSEEESVPDLIPFPPAPNLPLPNQPFKETFTCFPLSHKTFYERGGKLALPLWVLDEISFLNVPLPYTFKVTNKNNLSYSHVGVLEFTVETQDQVKVPSWLMKFLDLKKGDQVEIESVLLPSGTYCKLKPMTKNTAYISDVKNVLEQNLKYFACLTEGDILCIHEINKNQIYKMKVVETKPESAVTVFDCDLEIEFEVPSKEKPCLANVKIERRNEASSSTFKPFQGQGKRLNETVIDKIDELSEIEETEEQETVKKQSNAECSDGGISKEKKRKRKETDESEPPKKKQRKKKNGNDDVNNQLTIVREQQKNHVSQKSKENFEPFSGKGNTLKDN